MTESRRFNLGSFLEKYGSLFALTAILIWGCCASEEFRKAQNFLNVLRQNSFVGIIAVGMTFVIILGGIDLSVGAMVALLGGLGIVAMNAAAHAGGGAAGEILLAAGLMVAGGGLLGWFNGVLIAKGRIAPFIATLGTMAAYRSLSVAVAQGGQYTSAVPAFGYAGGEGVVVPWVRIDGGAMTLGFPVLAFALIAAVGHVVLKHTSYGMFVHSIGDNVRAAEYSAVKIARVRMITYALLGAVCGVTAFLVASRHESVSSSQTGNLYELDAIAAVVVGGTAMRGGSGRVWHTVIGVLILGFVGNMMSMVITPWLQQHLKVENLDANHLEGLIKGLIIIAAVLMQRGRKD